MTKLERNAHLYDVLVILGQAYRSGDFEEFIGLLASNCIYESMWVLEPLCGRDAVSNHLLKKGKSIQESDAFPDCWIVELVGNMNPTPKTNITINGEEKIGSVALAYESGKYCLMMEQELDGKTNGVLLDVKLTADGQVSRIDLCMPELFNTRSISPCISICPANGDNENEEAAVLISYPYFSELYAFLYVADQEFSEYDEIAIPMNKWQRALGAWKEFADADNYDDVIEKFCGMNYENWTIANKGAFYQFQRNGARLWQRRKEHSVLLKGLLEWTKKYSVAYGSIHSSGY